MGYLIEPNTKEIITAKVTLSSADLLTPGYIYSIPEYPATKDYFWNVLYMNGLIDNGSTPYTGNSGIHIQANGVSTLQLRFPGAYMQGAVGLWSEADFGGTAGIKYSDNAGLEIHNPGTLTAGDTELILYIGAILIKK